MVRFLRADSTRRVRAFTLAVVVTLAFLILPSWNTWRFYRASAELSTQELRLQQTIGVIVHLDELLTMSARMAAATGDLHWEARYREYEPKLDEAIEEAIRLAAGSSEAAERTATANHRLVAIENEALALVRAGRSEQAWSLLSGDAYELNKRAYAAGMRELTAEINARIQRDLAWYERGFVGAGALTVLSALALLIAWVGVVVLIWRHLAARARAEAERKEHEAQIQHVQKLESLGVLAGGIAHDLNNLLMPILGYADLALDELPTDSPSRAKLERLRNSGAKLSGLTDQLLAYTGKSAFELRGIELSRLVEEMRALLEMSVSAKAKLDFELSDELPRVEGDASQLGQVVMNLVTNASDALGQDGGRIVVRTGCVEVKRADPVEGQVFGESTDGEYVFLEVSDTGAGMDAVTQSRVFDPFFTTKRRGRGLGLAVTLGIVRSHHGVIRLRSAVGRGTTFRILFPASERKAEEIAVHPPPSAAWTAQGAALVVEDQADVREVVETMLRRFGFAVVSAEDGRAGVETFRKHADDIAVVLLDLTMPTLSGEQALEEIRRIRPEQRVVLMSGYDEEFVGSRCADEISSFIQKPFTQADLRAALRPLFPSDRGPTLDADDGA